MNTTRNPHELAEKYKITLAEAREMLRNELTPLEGWGRVNLQQHIISRRRIGSAWPRADKEALDHNRGLHDQGRVTMCQGRDGDHVIQYAIPTMGTAIKRRAVFSC